MRTIYIDADACQVTHTAEEIARRSGKHHLKGPAKRTEEDDRRFAESLEGLITAFETL